MYGPNDDFADDYNSYDYNNRAYEGHSGDPRQDLEYEKHANNPNYHVPDEVRGFILHFYRCLKDGKLFEVGSCYETR
ncbi:eukaryotic translation initiation factor 3 subunit L-like [Anneissia japonica]|uniref:eukaryotic translation initiation factor 3 subunit L-like n=1 Tax=Anneissia japonica TaxID=1529436 RepID=UPI0014257A43|nr:eukaryotic translation initiation factor 3 subunit L-like [Anneissia japonica]